MAPDRETAEQIFHAYYRIRTYPAIVDKILSREEMLYEYPNLDTPLPTPRIGLYQPNRKAETGKR